MLKGRQAKFVDEYMLDHNGSRAARSAGYAESGARVTAHRLLTNANVKAAIELKTSDLAEKYELDKHVVVNQLLAAIKLAEKKQDAGTLIRGWVEVAKIMGFIRPKVDKLLNNEHSHLNSILEVMSDEELVAILHK